MILAKLNKELSSLAKKYLKLPTYSNTLVRSTECLLSLPDLSNSNALSLSDVLLVIASTEASISFTILAQSSFTVAHVSLLALLCIPCVSSSSTLSTSAGLFSISSLEIVNGFIPSLL